MISPRSIHSLAAIRTVPFVADPSLPALFGEQLAGLYDLVQRSQFVFGSPLGPFAAGDRSFHLPRFVYFGPHASDVSLRLAFLAGHDHRDLRSTLALLHLIEQLALKPDLGQGLNLSFFPVIDVLGLAGLAADRALRDADWTRSTAPEIDLLGRDAQRTGYHGFVRLESAPGQDLATVQLRFVATDHSTPDVELISSEDFDPYPVLWQAAGDSREWVAGPLTLAGALPVRPFELTIRLPSTWCPQLYREATTSILKRFIIRHRAFIAYAQNL